MKNILNIPSREIARSLDITPEQVREIKAIIRCTENGQAVLLSEAAAERVRECYHPPSLIDVKMHAINKILDTYGVEYLKNPNDTYRESYGLEYCNSGDTYNTTILYSYIEQKFIMGNWGDVAEQWGRAVMNNMEGT